MKDDKLYLIHIAECIARIEQYTQGGSAAFMGSTLIQDAVLRNLQTMAQSVRNLSEDMKAQHPEIDWRGIIGFRNVLVHDYLAVDMERTWDIVDHDLPDLKHKIEAILGAMENRSSL